MTIVVPDPDTLVVPVADVAVAAGLDPEDDAAVLTAAILDAQADVEAYLGRVIVPTGFTVTGAYAYGVDWVFDAADDPVWGVATVTAETDDGTVDGIPTGYYTLVYVAGLDAVNDPALRPIRRYVKAAAINDPEILRRWQATGARGAMTAVSTLGQSASWSPATHGGGGAAGSGVPGALPTLGSLDRWRVAGRRVFQRAGTTWQRPYDGGLGL